MERKLLFESAEGVCYYRVDRGKESSIEVFTPSKRKSMVYRMKNIPFFEHPLLSWQNLDQCYCWWFASDTYLYTAVQNETKLVADMNLKMSSPASSEADVLAEVQRCCPNLFNVGVIIDNGDPFEPRSVYNVSIVRAGCLSAFFALEEIVEAYHRLGVEVSSDELAPHFSREIAEVLLSYEWWNSRTKLQLILTGLMLGYPIETTASLILGNCN